MSEGTEVERLRARVAELEAQLQTEAPAGGAAGSAGAAAVGAAGGAAWRATASALLVTLACVLAPLSVTAVWASGQLSDTDRYVDTVAPLAQDPAVRSAVANEVTTAVMRNIDVQGLTTQLVDAVAAQENVPPRVAAALPGLVVPLTNGIEQFTRTQITNLMATPQFAQAWAEANRVAHTQVVQLLEGNQGGAISAQGDTVTLNLAPIIEQVKTRLVAQGFTLAENVPVVNRSFVLVQSDAITQAQGFYSLLNTLGAWLGVIALALFAAGLYLARDRRRALLRGALGVVASMVLLGVALTVVRATYVSSTPAGVLTPEAAGSVFDTLVRFLRTGLRAAAVLGLLVALGAFLVGPSAAAVRTRTWVQGGVASLRGSAESAGWDPGPAGTWAHAHKGALRAGILVAAGLALMFWNAPTVGTVVVIAVLALLLLGALEFVARPAPDGAAAGAESVAVSTPGTPAPGPVIPSPRSPAGGGPVPTAATPPPAPQL